MDEAAQALNRDRFEIALRDVYASASDAAEEEAQDSLDAVHRALEALGKHVGLVQAPEDMPDRSERIEVALHRLASARALISEAMEDMPLDLTGVRRTLHETGQQINALMEDARESGAVDELLARWIVLRPRVEARGDGELDADDLTEAIHVSRAMDQSGHERYERARAWFQANGLPTNYRPVREA